MFKIICQLIGLVILGMIADVLIKIMFWPIIIGFVLITIAAFIYSCVKEN